MNIEGPEAYPYDPTLDIESLSGLDRLRGIADRKLAGDMFVLFKLAEANTSAARVAEQRFERLGRSHVDEVERLKKLAADALQGKLGEKPKELAECLLTDERGRLSFDERLLRELQFALATLKKVSER